MDDPSDEEFPSDEDPEPQEDPDAHVTPEPQQPPMDMGDPGRQAVRNGAEAEMHTRDRLLRLGYQRMKTMPECKEHAFFIAQWRSPFKTIYGRQLVPDFYVWHPRKHPGGVLIEHKYQEKGGTTDQKLPHTVAGLKRTGLHAILVMTGPGFDVGARLWCKEQEDAFLTVVISSDEWTMRLNRGLL